MTSSIRNIRFVVMLAIVAAIPLLSLQQTKADTGMPSGNENTVVHAQNASASVATIVMDIYTNAGILVTEASDIRNGVQPGGAVRFQQVFNDGIDPGFRGVGVLSSDNPIYGLVARDILASGNLKSYSLANASEEGGTLLAIPFALNELVTADWNSRVSVANTGESTACVRATYFLIPGRGGSTPAGANPAPVVDNGPGGGGCAQGHPIPSGGQLVLGREPDLTRFPQSTDNNQMAMELEVLNPNGDNDITANVDVYRSDGNRLLESYTALVDDGDTADDDVGTEIIIPVAMKSMSGWYTFIGIMNRGDAAADVNIQYIGRTNDGTGTPVNQTVTLQDVEDASFHSTYSPAPNVPTGFIGYAKVTSSEPIAAVVRRGKMTFAGSGQDEARHSAVNGVPADQTAQKWSLPVVFRNQAGVPGLGSGLGYNSWIQVQVADGTSAQVTLRFVGDPSASCPVGPFQSTHTVDGSRIFYLFRDQDNGFPAGNNPSCFYGGATVTANKDVVVIGQVGADKFPNGDDDALYNAFPE